MKEIGLSITAKLQIPQNKLTPNSLLTPNFLAKNSPFQEFQSYFGSETWPFWDFGKI